MADVAGASMGKGAQTRMAVLEAAIVRFGREGYRATSVAEIARDAGVGGTVPYAYFPNKEDLFLGAVDADAAQVIEQGLAFVREDRSDLAWRDSLIYTLLNAVGNHPLTRRLLAGLEPDVTLRVLGIPALGELRTASADRLRSGQKAGVVRHDVDPDVIANGIVTTMLSLLMSVVQLGDEVARAHVAEVTALFDAAVLVVHC